MKITVALM